MALLAVDRLHHPPMAASQDPTLDRLTARTTSNLTSLNLAAYQAANSSRTFHKAAAQTTVTVVVPRHLSSNNRLVQTSITAPLRSSLFSAVPIALVLVLVRTASKVADPTLAALPTQQI
jgi:hypothetical protein